MLPEHVRRSALLVLVQELQVLRIWRCGLQSFKVEEGRFQLPFNIFTSSCQARTGKLLFGIHIRRKQWITSKGESLRPDGTCWNLLERVGTCWNLIDLMECCNMLGNMLQSDAISASMCVWESLRKPAHSQRHNAPVLDVLVNEAQHVPQGISISKHLRAPWVEIAEIAFENEIESIDLNDLRCVWDLFNSF